jgi:alkanesulfonate monooxygenase SsuD/methylene tetrahydromethanopterin reductase-like flavin-dependent oxidoreductase (luciferase family)
LAAKYFDHLNIIATFDQLPQKVKVVRERCEEIGRDPATLETSMMVTAIVDENLTPDKPSEAVGSAEQIADQVKTKVFGAGIDGVIINLPTERHGYRPGDITALGEALKPLVSP